MKQIPKLSLDKLLKKGILVPGRNVLTTESEVRMKSHSYRRTDYIRNQNFFTCATSVHLCLMIHLMSLAQDVVANFNRAEAHI